MCGFLIYFSKKNLVNKDIFKEALSSFSYRGPDYSESTFYDLDNHTDKFNLNTNSKYANLAIGHNRLSLVDLSNRSNQPLSMNGKILCFNGEIYDFKDFSSYSSDTHYLHNFLDCGKDSSNLNGAFSFSFIDLNKKNILSLRDYYGKRPLYFYHDKDKFIISSDFMGFKKLGIKFIFNKFEVGRSLIFKTSLDYAQKETIWKNIYSLKPNEILEYSFDNNEKKFSTLSKKLNFNSINTKNFVCDFKTSVKNRLSSEVKTAITLSGGLDSSLISIIASSLDYDFNLYTVKTWDQSENEDLFFSRKIANKLGRKLNELTLEDYSPKRVTGNVFLDYSIECLSYANSIIPLTNSTLPTYLYTKAMANDGNKCFLDGVGADEIFGGYPNYNILYKNSINLHQYNKALFYLKNSLKYGGKNSKEKIYVILDFIKSFVLRRETSVFSSWINFNTLFKDKTLFDGFFEGGINLDLRTKFTEFTEFQKFDITNYQLPMYLKITDSMSMANSIENRSPFLDERFINYLDMPVSYKHSNGKNKILLRNTLSKLGFDDIANRKLKKGNSSLFSLDEYQSSEVEDIVYQSNFIRENFNLDSPIIKTAMARLLPIAILDSYSAT